MLFIHSFPSTYLQVKPGAQITCKCVAFWCFHKLTLSVEAARELSGGRAGGQRAGRAHQSGLQAMLPPWFPACLSHNLASSQE